MQSAVKKKTLNFWCVAAGIPHQIPLMFFSAKNLIHAMLPANLIIEL